MVGFVVNDSSNSFNSRSYSSGGNDFGRRFDITPTATSLLRNYPMMILAGILGLFASLLVLLSRFILLHLLV